MEVILIITKAYHYYKLQTKRYTTLSYNDYFCTSVCRQYYSESSMWF